MIRRHLTAALGFLLLLPGLAAQQGPPSSADPGQHADSPDQRVGPPPDQRGDDHRPFHRGSGPPPNGPGQGGGAGMRGLQLGPPGRWWNDAGFAASLHLQPDQQARLDKIFSDNKQALFSRFDELKLREQELEILAYASKLDEQALFAGIDRVAAARAALEKANAHMQLQLRMQLSPDQVKMLDQHRPMPPQR